MQYKEQEHIEFFNYARELGIDYGTSAFTKKDVDFCIDQKCANLKVASCDVTNLDLIEYVISKDYPTQIALGMASLAEIEAVVKLIPERFKHNVTLFTLCFAISSLRMNMSTSISFIHFVKHLAWKSAILTIHLDFLYL